MYELANATAEAVDPAQWTSIASQFADCTYEQVYDYSLAAAAKVGATTLFLDVASSNGRLGAASVRLKTIPVLGRGIAYVSAGPLTCNAATDLTGSRLRAVLGALKRKLVDEEGHVLRVRLPLLPPIPSFDIHSIFADLGFQPSDKTRTYRTIVVDIRPDIDVLRKNLAGKWRTDLNFASKAGLSIDVGTGADMFSRFQNLFDQMLEKKQFPVNVHPSLLFNLGAKCTGLDVMIAHKDGRDAAGYVFSALGQSAIYLFGATNDLGRETKAAYLMNWSAMLRAKERGALWYDLGGIDPEGNPDVYRFKSRMGGQDMTAVGPYEARPAGITSQIIDGLERIRSTISKIRG